MGEREPLFEFIGYAVVVGAALIGLAWIWGLALSEIGHRCMESKQFFDLVVRYARENNTKRVMGMDE